MAHAYGHHRSLPAAASRVRIGAAHSPGVGGSTPSRGIGRLGTPAAPLMNTAVDCHRAASHE
eukprot:6748606-Prymnesium_polylepis.1